MPSMCVLAQIEWLAWFVTTNRRLPPREYAYKQHERIFLPETVSSAGAFDCLVRQTV